MSFSRAAQIISVFENDTEVLECSVISHTGVWIQHLAALHSSSWCTSGCANWIRNSWSEGNPKYSQRKEKALKNSESLRIAKKCWVFVETLGIIYSRRQTWKKKPRFFPFVFNDRKENVFKSLAMRMEQLNQSVLASYIKMLCKKSSPGMGPNEENM